MSPDATLQAPLFPGIRRDLSCVIAGDVAGGLESHASLPARGVGDRPLLRLDAWPGGETPRDDATLVGAKLL